MALRGQCGICGAAWGPHRSLGPGKGAPWPPGWERRAGAGLAGGGGKRLLLLTHRHSAGQRRPARISASRKHFPNSFQTPQPWPWMRSAAPSPGGGGTVGRLWALSGRPVVFCPGWSAGLHGRARVPVPGLVGVGPRAIRSTPPPRPSPSGRCQSRPGLWGPHHNPYLLLLRTVSCPLHRRGSRPSGVLGLVRGPARMSAARRLCSALPSPYPCRC